ncbi:hypothetical protein BH24CHL7_BH24CHL7_05690 [soil metagenome]
MTEDPQPRQRLDEMSGPGWVDTTSTLLRGAGIAVAVLLVALGFFTGGFFLALTLGLAAVAVIGGFALSYLARRESWYRRPNARTYSLVLLVAFPLAIVAFAQLVGPALTPPPVTANCFQGEVGPDGKDDVQLAIDPRISSMQFRIRVPVLEDGALRWWASDPAGETQWGGRAEEPGFSDVAQPATAGGLWTLSVRGETSRAQYAIEWRGATADQPLASASPCG